jgi:hypothetical protein
MINCHRPYVTPSLIVALLSLLVAAGSLAQTAEKALELDVELRTAIVNKICDALNRIYVFPDTAAAMARNLQQHLRDGDYDAEDSASAFAQHLTEDLRAVYDDRHLRVEARPGPVPAALSEDEQAERERQVARSQRHRNYGFRMVKILAGNVGYIELTDFDPPEVGGATAVAAMNFVAKADALIVDLRGNGGGEPSMVQLITSYLFDEPTQLNGIYNREMDSIQQFWTQAYVPGSRLPKVPVFVLTSEATFSASEDFCYILKTLERATIVGETTGGGAHPEDWEFFEFESFHIALKVPYGRAVNPITGTNWEQVGVEPDIQVPADMALTIAHIEALKQLEEKEEAHDRRHWVWARRLLEVELKPVILSPDEREAYVGRYGPRTITLRDGDLWYEREGRPPFRLTPMGDDTFLVEGLDHFRLRFERDSAGKVVRIVGLGEGGDIDSHERVGR